MGGGAKTPEEVAVALVAKFCHDAEHYSLGWNPLAGKGLDAELTALVAAAIRAAWTAATERAAGKVDRYAAGLRAVNGLVGETDQRARTAATLDGLAKSIRDGEE